MPSSAICLSTASSQAASGRASSRSRLRERKACSKAAARDACPGSIASTSRSTKRLRSPGGPLNSPSSEGVIHTRRRCSLKALDDAAGAPLSRVLRIGFDEPGLALDAGSEHGRAERPFEIGDDREPARPADARHLGKRRAAQAPARGEKRQGLEQIRLADAVLAAERDQHRFEFGVELRKAAEIGEPEARDARRAHRGSTCPPCEAARLLTRASASARRAWMPPRSPASAWENQVRRA